MVAEPKVPEQPLNMAGSVDSAECGECGYALRGLSAEGECPECGHAISKSLEGRGGRLSEKARRWRRRIFYGNLTLWGLAVGFPAINSWQEGWESVVFPWGALAALALGALVLVGAVVFEVRVPWVQRPRSWEFGLSAVIAIWWLLMMFSPRL